MEITLDCLCPGMEGVVRDVNTEDALRRRLAEFGLVPGTKVRCRYRSPDGGVTAIGLRGAVLALRTGDLRRITVGIG
jgi:ferrous iron transport protein A